MVANVPRLTPDLVAHLRRSCQSTLPAPQSGALLACAEKGLQPSARILGVGDAHFDSFASAHPEAIQLCLVSGLCCHELRDLWRGASSSHHFAQALALQLANPRGVLDEALPDIAPNGATTGFTFQAFSSSPQPCTGQFSPIIQHSLTHFPRLQGCDGCDHAKRTQPAARLRGTQRSGPHLRILTLDYLGARLPVSLDGCVRLICGTCEDLFFAEALPSRAADLELLAFLDFCHREMEKAYLTAGETWACRSDREGSLMSKRVTDFLLTRHGIRRTSPAHRPTAHGVGEAAVRKGFEGMSATIVGAHGHAPLWSYAARTFAYNVSFANLGQRPGSYQGRMLPFGLRGHTVLPPPTATKAAHTLELGRARTTPVCFLQVDRSSSATVHVLYLGHDGHPHVTTLLERGIQWDDAFAFSAPSPASLSFVQTLDSARKTFGASVSRDLSRSSPAESQPLHPDQVIESSSDEGDAASGTESPIVWVQCSSCRKWRVTNPAQVEQINRDEKETNTRIVCSWLSMRCSTPQWDPRVQPAVAKLLRDSIGCDPSEGDLAIARALVSLSIAPRETRRGPYSSLDWAAADQAAVDLLRKTHTFGKVALSPAEVQQIPYAVILFGHMVRMIKHFELGPEFWKIKSRFVGSGNRFRFADPQHHSADLFAFMSALPAGMREFRIFCIMALLCAYEIELADVEGAYLVAPKGGPRTFLQLDESNAKLFDGQPGDLIEVLKGLPGTRDAGEDWDVHNAACLVQCGYRRDRDVAPSVWRRDEGSGWGGLLYYVDDAARAGTPATNAAAWTELRQHYTLSEPTLLGRMLGSLYSTIFLGQHRAVLRIDQRPYWQHALECYRADGGFTDGPSIGMPSAPHERCAVPPPHVSHPAKHVGKLLFGQRSSGPHLKYAIRALACNVSSWCEDDDARLYRIMRYLHQHPFVHDLFVDRRDCGLVSVVSYADADFGTEVPSRHSTSSCDVFIVGPHGTHALIDSISVRQTSVSLSTPESEVDALIRASKATISAQLLCEFLSQTRMPRGALSDAKSAILAIKKGHSQQMRHMRITQGPPSDFLGVHAGLSLSWARRHISGRDGGDPFPYLGGSAPRINEGCGQFVHSSLLDHVPTGANVSDLGTKPILLPAFQRCSTSQGIRHPDHPVSWPEPCSAETELVARLTESISRPQPDA